MQRLTIILLVMLAVILVLMLLQSPVFAASYTDIWQGDGWSMFQLRYKFARAYRLLKSLVAPCTVVSIAFSSFKIVFGNEKEQEKEMGRIKFMVFAVAALFLLPAFITLAYDAVADIAWDPASPDFRP